MRRVSLLGRDVPALGAGDVSLARAAARGLDDRAVERALTDALTAGLLVVDVHPEADAERLVGVTVRALRLRDAAVIATHVPALAERAGRPTRDVLPERLPPPYVQDRVEATLRALRLDAIPLALLPVRAPWRASRAWPEVVGTCARLVHEGKVLAWGALVDDADLRGDDAPAIVREPWLAALQVTYSACARAADRLLEVARERALPVLARRPLAGGALAGALGPGVKLKPRDDRHALDDAALTEIAVEVARLAPLVRAEPPAARSCDAARAVRERGRRPEQLEADSLADLALRVVLDRGLVALPRLHRPEHVLPAFAALTAPPLSAELTARVLEGPAPARAAPRGR